MSFNDIVGQKDAKELLKNAIKMGNVSHAYIISGEAGSGKKMLANAFAQMLLCENPTEHDACCQCHSCKQAMSFNNPDILYVNREDDKKQLGVDVIREKINNDVVIKPYSNKYKVYIVDEAEKMNQQAQNALLKTIEEPPEYAVIILLTANHNSFLQTILSRCVTITMKPIEDSLIKKTLQEKYSVVDYQSEIVASFAQGNLGKAISLTLDNSFNDMKADITRLIKKASKIDEYEVQDAVKLWATYKAQTDQILDLITLWFRDVLLYKATGQEIHLIFKEDLYDIKEQASNCSYSGLDAIFNAIDEARTRYNANVNYELMLELLILAIKENTK